MTRLLRSLVLLFLFSLAGVAPTQAQTYVKLWPNGASGSIEADTEAITVTNAREMGTMGVQVAGTFTGTLTPQCTVDGSNWAAIQVSPAGGGTPVSAMTAEGIWTGSIAGCKSVRVVATAAMTGEAVVTINTIQGGGGGAAAAEITIDGEALAVGAQPATDPHFVRCSNSTIASPCLVTLSGTNTVAAVTTVTNPVTVTDGAGALNTIVDSGTITAVTTVTNPVTVTDGSGSLNVIVDSGTITANLGATDNAVLDDIADGIAVTNAGTFAVQSVEAAGALLTSSQLIDNIVAVEDAVAGSGFSGVPILAVRQDSQSDLAADGDFIPVTVDADGLLRVTVGGGSGGTAVADDADFTAGTTSFTPTGGFYQSSVTACTDGDACTFGLTAQRTMKVTLFSAAGTELTQDTQATHATSLGTITSVTGGVMFGNASTATPTDVGADGDAAAIWLTRTGAVNIADAGGSITVDGSVTTTEGSGALLTSSQLIDNIVSVEDAVAGSAFSGVATLAVRQDSQVDLCADGDFCPLTVDADGLLRVTVGGGSGGTALADDADFTAGTTSFTPVGGFYQSSVTACTDGDVCTAGITAQRTVKTTLFSSAGAELTQDTQATHATSLGTITSVTGGVLFGNASTATPTDVGADGDAAAIWLTRSGAVNVADGGGTLTVDGTVTITDGAGAVNVICDSGCAGGTQYDEDAAHASGNTGTLALVVRNDAGTALAADGDNIPLMVNSAGALYTAVAGVATAANQATVISHLDSIETIFGTDAIFGTAGTADADVLTIQGVASMTPVLATLSGTNNIATVTTVSAVTAISNALPAGNNNIGDVDVATIAAGDNNIGNVDIVTLPALAAGTNTIGAVRPAAHTAGGCTPHSIISANSVNETEVKATAGQLYALTVTNIGAAAVFFKLYNDTAANIDENDTPVQRIVVPGDATGAGVAVNLGPVGMAFSTAVVYRITTGIADNSTGAIAANEVLVSACYL